MEKIPPKKNDVKGGLKVYNITYYCPEGHIWIEDIIAPVSLGQIQAKLLRCTRVVSVKRTIVLNELKAERCGRFPSEVDINGTMMAVTFVDNKPIFTPINQLCLTPGCTDCVIRVGETNAQFTDRLTGADQTGRKTHPGRNRQCSIGYHDQCTDLYGDVCRCVCHGS